MKVVLTYLFIFTYTLLALILFPATQEHIPYPQLIFPATALLFVLLVALSVRLIGWQHQVIGILMTALFIGLFFPSSETFFQLDWGALRELGSQCIVPFFMGQYNRICRAPFTKRYMIMLLMGIFCSYTHDGITIPLCTGFIWLAFMNRNTFFRTACWPMVIGFVIGTSISIWQANNGQGEGMTTYLTSLPAHTTASISLLWDTKIFILTVALTAYLCTRRWGRDILLYNFREHPLLAHSALFSICTMPFAPLGLDNVVKGVCFFCMFWSLLLGKSLIHRFMPLEKIAHAAKRYEQKRHHRRHKTSE